MNKLGKKEFEKNYLSFNDWYIKYCIDSPYYNFSDSCLKEYKVLFNYFNKYTSIIELSDLNKTEKKKVLIIQAYLFHYNQYLLYKEYDLINVLFNGSFVFKKDNNEILDKLSNNIEKGIKKIDQASKIKLDEDTDFIFNNYSILFSTSNFFARTYRLIFNDKANYYDYIEDYDKEEEILNYLIECEKNNIVNFSLATRVNLVKLLLKNDNPNMDLIIKYNDEILDSNAEELFVEHKMVISYLMYDYYKNNCEYEKALDVCNLFKDKTDTDLVDDEEKNNILNLIEERNRANVDNDNKLNTYFEEQIISKMSNDVKIMLNTSINMYDNYIKDKNNMSDIIDYSIVNISALKAVEGVLYEIIGVQYLEYLHSLNNLNLNGIPNGLKDKDDQGNFVLRNSVEFLEYGDAIRAMGKYINNNYIIKNNFKNFCISKNITEEKINRIPEFLNNLYILKEKRNTNAHKNRIDYNYASECKELLFDSFKIVEKLYDIFDNLL